MARPSIIYRHLSIYRAIMNLLYGGKYKQRFRPIVDELEQLQPASRVLELCFGDIYIARYCRRHRHHWLGLDINTHFISQAQRLGFDAQYGDVLTLRTLPTAEVCVMMGSFYHFHRQAGVVLEKMLDAAPVIIFSEPVSNLSSRKGLLGFIARRAANAGNGEEGFRYTRETFVEFINEAREELKFSVLEVHQLNRDLIIKIKRYGAS